MKRIFRLLLLTSSFLFLSQINTNAQAEAYIIGPTSLCVGECAVFEVALFDSTDFVVVSFWDYNGISLQGNPVTLCMDGPNGMSLVVSGFTNNQLDFIAETFIEPSSSIDPVIISTSANCPDSLAACDRVCAFNSATYEVTNIPPGSDVSWQVFGAQDDDLAKYFSGNEIMKGSDPIAQAYAGHQFGHFVPQLGDGRAINLGEVVGPHNIPDWMNCGRLGGIFIIGIRRRRIPRQSNRRRR